MVILTLDFIPFFGVHSYRVQWGGKEASLKCPEVPGGEETNVSDGNCQTCLGDLLASLTLYVMFN